MPMQLPVTFSTQRGNHRVVVALAFAATIAAAIASPATAQMQHGVPDVPTVNVTASATTSLPNDRVQAWLRAEAENPNPATAAAQVNTAVARALARIRTFTAVKSATSGYSTQQIVEKGKPMRWRVTQSITLDSGDFSAVAALVGRLQEEDGLLLSGMSFSVTDDTRARAEDAVTLQALRSWQERAQAAARGLGFSGWRPGRVTVQAGGGRPMPVMRAAAADAYGGAPVAIEAGTTDVTVTVTGDAVLDAARPPVPR
jgi:predicted secreted protein